MMMKDIVGERDRIGKETRLTAIDNNPGSVCFIVKFSSANVLVPYIHVEPVPSPLRKSPPWHMKSLI